MKVISRSETPDGIKIQAEFWNDSVDKYLIAAYPICKIECGYYHPNSECRIAIKTKNKKEAVEIYKNLKSGRKTLQDYKNQFRNGKNDQILIGL